MTITGTTGTFNYDTQLSSLLNFLKLEKEVGEYDKFQITYDPSCLHTLLEHYSEKYECAKTICYLPNEQVSFDLLYPFIRESLQLAWAEYLV